MKLCPSTCALCGADLTVDSEPVLPTTIKCDSCGAHNVWDDHKTPWPSSKGDHLDVDTTRLYEAELQADDAQEYEERIDELRRLGTWV